MKEEIRAYLQGPRDYFEGVALYRKHGLNLRLKKQLAIEETESSRAILTEELRKLAGLSLQELNTLPRLAADVKAPEAPAPVEPKEEVKAPDLKPATETQKKVIHFREKYTFLNEPDCPDVLKILVADMFTSFSNYEKALQRLHELGDAESEETARLSETAVEEYLKNREIWEELDYYRENKKLLGKAAKIKQLEKANELAGLTAVELIEKRRSAEVNISKRKKNLKEAEQAGDEEKIDREKSALATWLERKAAIDREVEARKKK